MVFLLFFFFQAEDGIRDGHVTGVQTCALPISSYQPRGKMLGGTSSLNGMVYMRGTPADYDGWRQRGCEGWDYTSVLPFFRKAEDQERGEDEFHGVGGPLKVSDNRFRSEIIDAVIEAAVQAGIPRND